MAKISDEIRKWADDMDSDDVLCTTATLYTLADRIDSEMAALPKTADGVPVHVGDTAYTYDGDGFEIVQIIIDQDKTRIVCSTGSGLDIMRLPSSVFHTRPDSFARIAAETGTSTLHMALPSGGRQRTTISFTWNSEPTCARR